MSVAFAEAMVRLVRMSRAALMKVPATTMSLLLSKPLATVKSPLLGLNLVLTQAKSHGRFWIQTVLLLLAETPMQR